MYQVSNVWLAYVTSIFFLVGCSLFNPEPIYVAPLPDKPKPVIALPPLHLEAQNANMAYVAEGNGHLYMCKIDSNTKKLTNCSITGTTEHGIKPDWLPNYVTVNTNNGINYAYVVSAQSIFVCNIAPDNGLINCHTTGSISQLGDNVKWLPTDIQFEYESAVTVAYITGVRTVYRCSLDNAGGLINCINTGESKLQQPMHWLPNGITFNNIGKNTYAYIAASNRVYQCLVDNAANLINCTKTGVNSTKVSMNWHPNDIVFTAQGGGFYAYVADPYSIYVCNVDANGDLLNCTRTGTNKDGVTLSWLPNTLVFNRTTSGKSAYIVGVYNIFVCDAQRNGLLTNCVTAAIDAQGKDMVWNPKGIYLKRGKESGEIN